ncbi:hypothetical protein HPB49_000717 [Dermacentor silvarum]|uniref:Uncharacterized protein n=1 Tax=Dermacentor silvarum TaxID=543639 RepID=A0ACB8D9M7_DERSI|nr:hypothetical protein HPB49_000717 [Dermacentor silvarum]
MMVAVPVVPTEENCELGETTSAQPAKRRLLDFQEWYDDEEAVAEVDELDTYHQSGGSSNGDGMDVLQWWNSQSKKLPRLAFLAKKSYAFPQQVQAVNETLALLATS